MFIIKNPAKARPLSANVKRLMRSSRAAPDNPDIIVSQRDFTTRDLAYCDHQGNIFMAAVDRGIPMKTFAPLYMLSQIAGIMDYSFSCAGGIDSDQLSLLLNVPILLKSPDVIVDTLVWLNNEIVRLQSSKALDLALMKTVMSDQPSPPPQEGHKDMVIPDFLPVNADVDQLADEYEYAYFLGYVYRYECLLHDESSRMVYGAFPEKILRNAYDRLAYDDLLESMALSTSVSEICRQLDASLIERLTDDNKE